MAGLTTHYSETLRDVLLNLEIADPVNLPPVSLTCTSVTLNPVMNWSWQDTQVVAFPGMLDSLNGKLEEHVDLQYPCHRPSLQLDRILEEVVPIEDENDVHSRLANTLSYGIKALVRHGMALESKFAIQMDSPNSGPVQPDIEVLVDGHCRWLIEAKRNLVAGPVIKALYNAAASNGPLRAGFLVQRKQNSNDVDLIGYQGENAETLGKILKQIIKYLNAMEQHHLLLSDAVNYVLCVRHPELPILYVGPPIGNAGLLKLDTPWEDVSVMLPVPSLPTHRPLGLALALCVIPSNEPSLVGPVPVPIHQRVPKRKASAEDAAIFKVPALPPPRMTTRSSSGSSSTPKDVPGLGRQILTIAHPVFPSFPSATHSLAWDIVLGPLYGPFLAGPSDTTPQLPVIRGMVEHLCLPSNGLPTPPTSPTRQIWQVYPKGSSNALFTLQRCVGSGRLWDTFEISIGESQRKKKAIVEPVPIGGYVLKVCCTPSLSDKTWAEDAYTKDDARQAAAREDALYRGPLLQLQGSVVPIWKGIFGGLSAITRLTAQAQSEGLETWAVLMQNAGTAVDVDKLSKNDRACILSAYRRLHRAGVLHRDARPRHWLRGADGRIMIIDFDVALQPKPGDKSLKEEEREVRQLLGLNRA